MRKALAKLVLLCFASSCPAESKNNRAPDWMTLMNAAHDNGYQEGYLAGSGAGGGGERLRQCNLALIYAERREADAKRYEACLADLKGALNGPEFYLRQIASQCAAELH